jgi:exopolysaccharide production protein ExoZ
MRGIAALLVVFHHLANGHERLFAPLPGIDPGGMGVAIFFVISGLIIYVAARDEAPREFVRRRLIRVVPLYWIALTAYLALVLIHPRDYTALSLDYIRSLLFIPYHMPGHPEVIYPLLIPGWTLNYEMFFYLLFFIGMLIGRLKTFLIGSILALVTVGLFVHSDDALIRTYTNIRLLQFLAGVLIGMALEKGMPPRLASLLPLATIAVLVLSWRPALLPHALIGIPAIALVLGAVAAEQRGLFSDRPFLSLIGDASYSIYLSHTFTIIVLAKLVPHLPLPMGWAQFGLWMAVGLVSSVLIGILVHKRVEKPLLAYLGRVTRPRQRKDLAIA